MTGDAGAHPKCEDGSQMTHDHTALQVRSSGLGRAGIGRSNPGKTLTLDTTTMDCSLPAAIHGAPRTQLSM